MVLGTAGLPQGRLDLESIVRVPLIVVADPVVAASGPPVTFEELDGRGAALLDRPAGTVLALANPDPDSGLFVWAAPTFVAVVSDPNSDVALDAAGELTITSARLVVGAPEVIAAWGPGADTGDGSSVRARMHDGRCRLGLIVVAHAAPGPAAVTVGAGAVAVSFSVAGSAPVQLPLAS